MAFRISLLLNCLLFAFLIGTLVYLEQVQAEDVVRITLTSDQVHGSALGPLANDLQRFTGKEAYAIRLNGTNDFNATKWQLRIDNKSAKLPPED